MMSNSFHTPVLLKESIDGLKIDPEGTYVDVTFGGGGHSAEILSRLGKSGKLLAFDQDADALTNALQDSRFQLINQNFQFIENYLELYNAIPVNGILADLGVSSHQFNTAERGFSTRFDSDLDMRMSQSSDQTAADIINTYEEQDLIRILREYGEIVKPVPVARAIIKSRSEKAIISTNQLKNIISKYTKPGKENKFYAQVFQALRIEVNQELEVLKNFLNSTMRLIHKGGFLVVITYHSLEDRLVKNFMKLGKFSGEVEKDFYGNIIRPFNPTSSKPIIPSVSELSANSRSRSAKLRIAIRN